MAVYFWLITLSGFFMLKYTKVTKDNIAGAIDIQQKIFHEHMPLELLESINNEKLGLYPWSEFYLVSKDDIYIGLTGLYGYDQYPDDVFMDWYGVLPQFRRHGYGKEILFETIKMAKEKKFRTFRLYTEVGDNDAAIALYRKIKMHEEPYTLEIGVKNMVMFSYPLTDMPLEKWKNRYIGIWSAYMLYADNLWDLVKTNYLASVYACILYPKLLPQLVKNKKNKLKERLREQLRHR